MTHRRAAETQAAAGFSAIRRSQLVRGGLRLGHRHLGVSELFPAEYQPEALTTIKQFQPGVFERFAKGGGGEAVAAR